MTDPPSRSFARTFHVPEIAVDAVARLVSPGEIAIVEHFAERQFSAAQAAPVLATAIGEECTEQQAGDVLDAAYRRGVLRMVDERSGLFGVSTFADFLELMVVGRTEEYERLGRGLLAELDAWCFDAYLASLGSGERPTSDRVASLDEALEHIDREERTIWLNTCDCSVLAGTCERPRRTCITFRSGINTTSHRGWSQRLTKGEAKDVVRSANAAGLMQTVNDDGICNCCADCCYLFRAQRARPSRAWPARTSIASLDRDECIECGLCVERCPFGVFELNGQGLTADLVHCRGCGLCAETCPTEAITMTPRGEDE